MSQFTKLINAGSALLNKEAGIDLTLISKDGSLTIQARGLRSQLRTVRMPDAEGNWRRVWSGIMSLNKAANPDLAEALTAINARTVPDDWRLEIDGFKYKLANTGADETAWDFDITATI